MSACATTSSATADDLDAPLLDGLAARVGVVGEAAAPHQHRHAERARTAGDFLADVAEAEQAERLPIRPFAFEYSFLFHVPARSSATLSGMRRSSARISPNVSSATATEFLPGQFET